MSTAVPEESVWQEKRSRQHGLYPRQRQALGLYAQGLKYTEVAEAMAVRVGTARSYIGAATKALGAEDPPEAVRIARKRGYIA